MAFTATQLTYMLLTFQRAADRIATAEYCVCRGAVARNAAGGTCSPDDPEAASFDVCGVLLSFGTTPEQERALLSTLARANKLNPWQHLSAWADTLSPLQVVDALRAGAEWCYDRMGEMSVTDKVPDTVRCRWLPYRLSGG